MRIPKKACCIYLATALWLGVGIAGVARASSDKLIYDASIAFIQAGQVRLERNFLDESYELGGRIQTSAMLRPFFSWTGAVAAVGHWGEIDPNSTGYLLDSTGRKGRRELTLVAHQRFTQYRSTRGWKEGDAPGGVDIMSVLFMSQQCFRGSMIHDGEDSYPIELRATRDEKVNLGSRRFKGATRRCDYAGEDLRGRSRDVSVWLAKPAGLARAAPVKIKVSVPNAPAGVLLLKLPEAQ